MEGGFLERPTRTNLVESELEEGPGGLNTASEAVDESIGEVAERDRKEESGEAVVTARSEDARERDPTLGLGQPPRLWAVGGGKGGVGKSLISANFALSLARRGRRVIAVDLDLGGANLHTCLGVEPPATGVGDWVLGRARELTELPVQTGVPGLRLISGSQDPLGIAALMEARQSELAKALRSLDADDIILDLGAGTHELTVAFFTMADRGIVSVLPEPTSVENAYRFIRAVIFRKFQMLEMPSGLKEIVDTASDPKNMLGIKTPGDLLAVVDRIDASEGARLQEILKRFDLSLVINQVRSPVDVDVGRAICSVCRRYFGIDVNYAGYLDYDSTVWKSVRSRKAVLREFPHSVLSNRIERLTRTLLGEERGLFP